MSFSTDALIGGLALLPDAIDRTSALAETILTETDLPTSKMLRMGSGDAGMFSAAKLVGLGFPFRQKVDNVGSTSWRERVGRGGSVGSWL
jgi:hypothetical protein